jgi:hypothetical protein
MGLPLLKDFLPEDVEPSLTSSVILETPPPETPADFERNLRHKEERARDVERAIEQYIAILRHHLRSLSEDEAESAFFQMAAEEARYRPELQRQLNETRSLRARALRWPNEPRKGVALRFYERQVRLYEVVLAAFERGKDDLESLRDDVVVRDAQKLSGPAFWGDDE